MKKYCALFFLLSCSVTSQAFEECASELSSSSKISDLKAIFACFDGRIKVLEAQVKEINDKTKPKPASPIVLDPPPNLKNGTILDLWLLDKEDLKMVPNTPSLGATVDKSKPFGFGNFRSDSDLSHYYKNKSTGLMWSGYLNVEEAGNHLILHEFDIKKTDAGMGWTYKAYSKLQLNDDVIIENDAGFRGDHSGLIPKSASIKLEPGKHKFQLWLAAKWKKHNGYWPQYELEPSNISVNIKWRKPSSRKTTAITVEDLFHK